MSLPKVIKSGKWQPWVTSKSLGPIRCKEVLVELPNGEREFRYYWQTATKDYFMNYHNPNCDGGYCTSNTGEVRVLPAGSAGNLILCHSCYDAEINYRKVRNLEVCNPFDLPKWEDLEVYEG